MLVASWKNHHPLRCIFNLPVDFQSLDWSWLQTEEEEQNSLEQASWLCGWPWPSDGTAWPEALPGMCPALPMSQPSSAPRWRSFYFPNRCGIDRGPRVWPSVGTASKSPGHWKSSITEAQQAWVPGRSMKETKPQRLLPLLWKKCSSTVAPQTTGQMFNTNIPGQSMNSPWCQPILSWPLLIFRGHDPRVLTVNWIWFLLNRLLSHGLGLVPSLLFLFSFHCC